MKHKEKITFYSWVQKNKKSPVIVGVSLILLLISAIINISIAIPVILNFFKSTLFYKQTLLLNLRNLTAGEQIDTFIDIIGKPKFVNDYDNNKLEYVFINRYFYLDAITDENLNVLQYAITTRDKNFNPIFETQTYSSNNEKYYVELGKTRFHELPEIPDMVEGCLGAHDYYYNETHYLGNPSKYQTYAFGVNMSGYTNMSPENYNSLWPITNCYDELTGTDLDNQNNPVVDEIRLWRNEAVINTFLITAPLQPIMTKPLGIGVNYYQIRAVN